MDGGRSKLDFIVALARKPLVSLWRFAKLGVVPYGAVLSAAGPNRNPIREA